MNRQPYKLFLPDDRMPTAWYNLRADMGKLAPMLRPDTLAPIALDDLLPVFVEQLARQELDDATRWIDIPGPVLDYYRTTRPTPLVRAWHLEKALDTPAKIYYKFEGGNTSGSHKLNSAAAQAYYAKAQGLTALTTETGAGQWGTALSMACAFFGLRLHVCMVRSSYGQKPYRKGVMETYGAKVTPSPSPDTAVGRRILENHPDTGGSLGCAISEALEIAAGTPNCRYVLGSMLNHVLLHQSIIGLEARAAMDMLGERPDIVIGCAGGGSNLGGLMAPWLADKLAGKPAPRFLAVEPVSCPSLTRGRFAYDYGDTGHLTPLVKMYTCGSDYIPHPNHAGGLRYHGMNPVLSQLRHDGLLEACTVGQVSVFEAATLFARAETILPAPESGHAVRAAIDQALACRELGVSKTILFGLSGTGYFDMSAYMSYMAGTLTDWSPSDDEMSQAFGRLPTV